MFGSLAAHKLRFLVLASLTLDYGGCIHCDITLSVASVLASFSWGGGGIYHIWKSVSYQLTSNQIIKDYVLIKVSVWGFRVKVVVMMSAVYLQPDKQRCLRRHSCLFKTLMW